MQVNISDAASLLKKIKSLARDTVSIMADWRPLYNGDEPSGEKATGRGSVADIEGRGGGSLSGGSAQGARSRP